MESIHIRVPSLILERVDRWAESHAVDRSTAIRGLLLVGLDAESIAFTIENAIRAKDIGLTRKKIADLGTSISYAVLLVLGKSPEEMSGILKDVREALLKS